MTSQAPLRVSVIVPVYNGRDYLERSLPPRLAIAAFAFHPLHYVYGRLTHPLPASAVNQ